MSKAVAISIGALMLSTLPCWSQQVTGDLPDAPKPKITASALPLYTPPTQGERFKTYVRHTFGIYSILEAGVRGGIDQGLDRPSEWPEGGQGYADRFGSAMGEIAIRGTTEYVVADAFHEDIRFIPCDSSCSQSAFKRALEDTFTARKGQDGHRAFSFARLLGPVSAGTVAKETWLPSPSSNRAIVGEIGVNYGFTFIRNYLRELLH